METADFSKIVSKYKLTEAELNDCVAVLTRVLRMNERQAAALGDFKEIMADSSIDDIIHGLIKITDRQYCKKKMVIREAKETDT
jgi:hypothetical protein